MCQTCACGMSSSAASTIPMPARSTGTSPTGTARDLEACPARLTSFRTLLHRCRLRVREHLLEDRCDFAHVRRCHPEGRGGGRADTQPARVPGPVRIERQGIAVERHVALADR